MTGRKRREKRLYPLVRDWLGKGGYYCGTDQWVVGSEQSHEWIDKGLRSTRFDVLGAKSIGGRFHEELEIVGVEVKSSRTMHLRDMNQALGYRRFVDRAFFAKPGDYSAEQIDHARRERLGLLSIDPKGRPHVREIVGAGLARPDDGLRSELLHALWVFRCCLCAGYYFGYTHDESGKDPVFVEVTRTPDLRPQRGADLVRRLCVQCAKLLGFERKRHGSGSRWVEPSSNDPS